MKLPTLGTVAKALGALGAGASVMVAAGLVTGHLAVWVSTAITAVLTAVATYSIPNRPATPQAPPEAAAPSAPPTPTP